MCKYVLICTMIAVVGFASGNPAIKTHYFGINGGILQPIGGYGDAGTHYHFGLLYWYETTHLVAEVSVYGIGRSDVLELCFPELSLLYMLSKKNISPYVGGGIGFGWLSLVVPHWFVGIDYVGAYGVILNAGGGILFFRTHDVRIILDARYRVNFANIRDAGGPHHGFKFSVGFTSRP